MKLNKNIKDRLILQAEEAAEQGLTKLAHRIINAIESDDNELENYSYSELKEEYYCNLWKMAKLHIAFYGIDNADVVKLDKTIVSWASKTIDELDAALEVNSIKGINEPKLPGEK